MPALCPALCGLHPCRPFLLRLQARDILKAIGDAELLASFDRRLSSDRQSILGWKVVSADGTDFVEEEGGEEQEGVEGEEEGEEGASGGVADASESEESEPATQGIPGAASAAAVPKVTSLTSLASLGSLSPPAALSPLPVPRHQPPASTSSLRPN